MESQEELVRGSGKANVGLKHQILQCKVHIILGPNHKHSHTFLHTPSLSAPLPINGGHPVGPIWAHKSGPTTYFSWTKESHWSWGFGPWPETDLSTCLGFCECRIGHWACVVDGLPWLDSELFDV